MSVLRKGLHLHCPGKRGHPLLTATRDARGVSFVALYRDGDRIGARGWIAGTGTVEASCSCQPAPMIIDLAKVARRMQTHGYGGVSVVEFLA